MPRLVLKNTVGDIDFRHSLQVHAQNSPHYQKTKKIWKDAIRRRQATANEERSVILLEDLIPSLLQHLESESFLQKHKKRHLDERN